MRKEHEKRNGIECKECSRCKRWLPLCEYGFDSSKWDGLHGFCRSCTKEVNRKTYIKYSTEIRKRMYEYRHKPGYVERPKPYNPQYFWGETARVKKRARDLNRRALKANADKMCKITPEIIHTVIKKYGSCCAYCGSNCSTNYEIDHKIPLTRNGTNDISNLALSCPHCNRSKRNKTDEEYCGHKV